MTKQTKDGWIRHRGGNHNIHDDLMVQYRCRSGGIYKSLAGGLLWRHEGSRGDIMAYRVCEPVVESDAYVSTEEAMAYIDASHTFAGQLGGPLQWRDRINEINSTIETLTCERADLKLKLADEGLQLIEGASAPVNPAEDMGDWRNWRAGDLLRCIDGGSGVVTGQTYQYTGRNEADEDYVVIWVESNEKGCFSSRFKFHSRPAN